MFGWGLVSATKFKEAVTRCLTLCLMPSGILLGPEEKGKA
jgi:hypothetical protein